MAYELNRILDTHEIQATVQFRKKPPPDLHQVVVLSLHVSSITNMPFTTPAGI